MCLEVAKIAVATIIGKIEEIRKEANPPQKPNPEPSRPNSPTAKMEKIDRSS